MKITIDLDFYTLKRAKDVYRLHFGYPEAEKVTRADLASWFAGLVQGDMDSVHGDESELEEED